MRRSALFAAPLAALLALAAPVARADAIIGSSNVASVEPPVSVPDEAPCAVPLFADATFGADTVNFSYTPPAACPGPWAKIVLSADVSLNAGRQFDRTATIFIGGVNVLFGTTAEPRAALAPSWHVERDLTDDTALLRSAQPGHVLIANYQSSVYTSTITASARLLFYPATRRFPAPVTPDLVIPLNTDPSQGTTGLADGTQSLSRTGTLPTNIEKARLDVLLQSQGNDEFWYTCVPDALATALETCGGGAFREGLVSIDGVPAGVAPVFPWIYTGGIDPYLWEPIPGVQTLAFKPTSIDLTPFAGVVDDGQPHTLSLAVAGANQSFSVTGTLYLTLDKKGANLRGGITRNTLAAATPSVTNTIATANGATTGKVDTEATHDYTISGYVQTSHGKVTTTVSQLGHFSNIQNFDVTSLIDDQAITQRTDTRTTVTTQTAFGKQVSITSSAYPFDLDYRYVVAADGSASQATSVKQELQSGQVSLIDGVPVQASAIDETIAPSDTLNFDTSGALTTHTGAGTAAYLSGDTAAGCVTTRASTLNSVLTTYRTDRSCAILRALLATAAMR